MKRLLKLGILILLSLSVYFIYQKTKDTTIQIMNVGDSLALGINSYGVKDNGYIDFYIEELKEKNIKVIDKYAKKDLTIDNLYTTIQNNNVMKRDLRESHQLILCIGYNDLIYKLNLEENLNNNKFQRIMKEIEEEYNLLIKEITKYYKYPIIVIGYYSSNKEDYYLNKGIEELNNILEKTDNSTYIDTYDILKNRQKYFSNPHSYYPNILGYQRIAQKIITKTLEN